MLRWIADVVGTLGYVGIALLMAIENVVLPLPSELIMPLAGFTAERSGMSLWGVILAGTIGSVAGALPVYAYARAIGEERLSRWVDAHGRWLLLNRRNIERSDERLRRHGALAVLVSQLLPGARGLVSLPAGFARVNVVTFTIANFAGTIVWCAVLAVAGEQLGAHFTQVNGLLGPVGWGILAIGVTAFLVRRLVRKRRRRGAEGSAPPRAPGGPPERSGT